eukprot:scaffold422703_cov71-Attheya_sp.AAC.1
MAISSRYRPPRAFCQRPPASNTNSSQAMSTCFLVASSSSSVLSGLSVVVVSWNKCVATCWAMMGASI